MAMSYDAIRIEDYLKQFYEQFLPIMEEQSSYITVDLDPDLKAAYSFDVIKSMSIINNMLASGYIGSNNSLLTIGIKESNRLGGCYLDFCVSYTGVGIDKDKIAFLEDRYEEFNIEIKASNGIGSIFRFSMVAEIADDNKLEDISYIFEARSLMNLTHLRIKNRKDCRLKGVTGTEKTDDRPILEGINWSLGDANTGNTDITLSTACRFYKHMLQSIEELAGLYLSLKNDDGQSDDYNNYRICVHGLKGVLATFGATNLSYLAYLIEMASKDNDNNRIDVLHPIFIEQLNLAYSNWTPLKISTTKTKSDDFDSLVSKLEQLKESAESLDFDKCDELLADICQNSYGEELDQSIEELSGSIDMLDDNMIINLCDGIISVAGRK